MDVWGELVPSKIFNPPFPVLKAGHSVSYSYICDVCRKWVNEVGFFLFFLNFPVWLVCYAHVFHVTDIFYSTITCHIHVYMYVLVHVISSGQNIQDVSEDGESLLSLACSAGYYELAEVLLRMRASVEDRGVKGQSGTLRYHIQYTCIPVLLFLKGV